MSGLIYGQDDRLTAWASEIIGGSFLPGARAIGLEGPEGLRAVSVFERFTPTDCDIHIATTNTGRAMSMRFIVASFAFPFIQLGQRRLTGLVPSNNVRAMRFDLKLGFRIEGRLREALPDQDIIVLGMLRRECRFIPREHRI